MESFFVDIITIIGVIAAGLRTVGANPTQRALEDALALAIITDILEATAEPLSQQELSETFRAVAREATASEQANERLANMKAERIWFLASQVKLRAGEKISIHDTGGIM